MLAALACSASRLACFLSSFLKASSPTIANRHPPIVKPTNTDKKINGVPAKAKLETKVATANKATPAVTAPPPTATATLAAVFLALKEGGNGLNKYSEENQDCSSARIRDKKDNLPVSSHLLFVILLNNSHISTNQLITNNESIHNRSLAEGYWTHTNFKWVSRLIL